MPVEQQETLERVSVFKNPVISVKVPSAWTNEASEYDAKVSETQEHDWLRGWHSARRIAKRAFAAYYGLQGQFQEKHEDWKLGRPDFDFLLTSPTRSCIVNLHTIPIKDHNPKIGRSFSANIYRANHAFHHPVVHVLAAWWCPVVFFVGWISNADLKERGKTEVSEKLLKPMYEHEVLAEMDTRGMFI